MRRLFALALIVLTSTAAAPSPGTCGPWVPQTDGSQWRMCNDTQNQLYCELKQGGKIWRIDCPD